MRVNNNGKYAPPDIETASDDYASRFAGPIGEWMLKKQADIVTQSLRNKNAERILDVGGGHAQLAIPLANAGYEVTVVGSDTSCSQRIRSFVDSGKMAFTSANLLDLPYADNSFDTVICFRYISHCGDWRRLIGELCRVAARTVVIDYPTWQSVNIASPLLFRIKKIIEKNTRTYTLFSHGSIRREFVRHSFGTTERWNQFFLPMALHRALQNVSLSDQAEKFCATSGLTRVLGSPVILTACI